MGRRSPTNVVLALGDDPANGAHPELFSGLVRHAANILAAGVRERGTVTYMNVIRIDHVQLAMPAGGEDAATAFYEGLLGLRRVPKPPHLEVRGGCWFVGEDVQLHLGVEADFRPARKAHPALLVSGLTDLVEALRDGGANVYSDQPLQGFERVYVDDPFGNRIELMEPH